MKSKKRGVLRVPGALCAAAGTRAAVRGQEASAGRRLVSSADGESLSDVDRPGTRERWVRSSALCWPFCAFTHNFFLLLYDVTAAVFRLKHKLINIKSYMKQLCVMSERRSCSEAKPEETSDEPAEFRDLLRFRLLALRRKKNLRAASLWNVNFVVILSVRNMQRSKRTWTWCTWTLSGWTHVVAVPKNHSWGFFHPTVYIRVLVWAQRQWNRGGQCCVPTRIYSDYFDQNTLIYQEM